MRCDFQAVHYILFYFFNLFINVKKKDDEVAQTARVGSFQSGLRPDTIAGQGS